MHDACNSVCVVGKETGLVSSNAVLMSMQSRAVRPPYVPSQIPLRWFMRDDLPQQHTIAVHIGLGSHTRTCTKMVDLSRYGLQSYS